MSVSPTASQLLPSMAMFTASLASPPFEKKRLTLLPKPYDRGPEWAYERRGSDESSSNDKLSSEQVLAEKRRRNAGASARFRDRRKQRERELQDRVQALEKKNERLAQALRELDPAHPLVEISPQPASPVYSTEDNQAILGRIHQLEQFIHRFRVEKDSDSDKLDQLDQENRLLKSLLTSITQKNQETHS
ncbi:hypothetical protein BY458DRAFT_520763 [Sporodiniella umbellata]|nr:hypothetical protein BY458DRAFT_520763 [Sporodiniella umbellata]